MPDFGKIEEFASVAALLSARPEVKALIPMGSQITFIEAGNELDRSLAALRAAFKAQDRSLQERKIAHLKMMIQRLNDEIAQAEDLAAEGSMMAAQLAPVQRAASERFWEALRRDPLPALEFLENEIAPLEIQGKSLGIWFLGTDPQAFAKHFPRFELLRGQMIPPGERGVLFNEGYYEQLLKHPVARLLDLLAEAQAKGRSLESDSELRAKRDRMVAQYHRLLFQLEPHQAARLLPLLQEELNSQAALPQLLQEFLQVDDHSLKRRRAFFYAQIASEIELYLAPVGAEIGLQSFSEAGYKKARRLKVWGTFRFRGLGDAEIARSHNLMDLVSFRELSGFLSKEQREELRGLRARHQHQDLSAEEAEEALFGGSAEISALEAPSPKQAEAPLLIPRYEPRYDPAELQQGPFVHAAVILKDPKNLEAQRRALQAALDEAGFKIKVVDWKSATGTLGQIVVLMRALLLLMLLILGGAALLVINNSMALATLERRAEIGTLRAIGASRRFITLLFMTETLILALSSGALGLLFGGGLVLWLGQVGLPAPSSFLEFLFSGERLFPSLSPEQLLGALFYVVLVGLISTAWPARLAANIPPVTAMAAE